MSVQNYEDVWASEEPEMPSKNAPVPVGNYDATVVSVKVKNWNDGGQSIEFEYQIVGGAYNGRHLWMNGRIEKGKVGRTKGFLALLGILRPTQAETVAAFPLAEGRGVKISVYNIDGKLYTGLDGLNDALTVARPAVAAPVVTAAPAPAVTQAIPFA